MSMQEQVLALVFCLRGYNSPDLAEGTPVLSGGGTPILCWLGEGIPVQAAGTPGCTPCLGLRCPPHLPLGTPAWEWGTPLPGNGLPPIRDLEPETWENWTGYHPPPRLWVHRLGRDLGPETGVSPQTVDRQTPIKSVPSSSFGCGR